MRRAMGGEAVRSVEAGRICFLQRAQKYKPVRGWVAIDAGRAASVCVNRKIAPAKVSTTMTSSSESDAGLGASQ
jgi:hypothetical protein